MPIRTFACTIGICVLLCGLLAAASAPSISPEVEQRRNLQYADRGQDAQPRRTSLDLYIPQTNHEGALKPIVVFIHGGAWAIGDKSRVHRKPAMITGEGWIFASVNYRLSPGVVYPAHGEDVAEAIAWIRLNAKDFGGDPDRVAIIGHSAGAHLAAVLATDPDLLAAHGSKPADLAGVVLLDGAGYDIFGHMSNPQIPEGRKRMYRVAFGSDRDVWEKASPILHAGRKGEYPPVLAVYAGRMGLSRLESSRLVESLRKSGARAELHHAREKDHSGVNILLGAPDADTKAVMDFLRSVLEQVEPDDSEPSTPPEQQPGR